LLYEATKAGARWELKIAKAQRNMKHLTEWLCGCEGWRMALSNAVSNQSQCDGQVGGIEMRIRDKFATVNGDVTEHVMPSEGLQIISDDGRTMFSITLQGDGSLDISGGNYCKFNGQILTELLMVRPKASNSIEVIKCPHQPSPK